MPAEILEGFANTACSHNPYQSPTDEGFEQGPTANSRMDDFKQRLEAIKAKKTELDNYATAGLQESLGRLQKTFTPYVTSCGVSNAIAPPGSMEKTVEDEVQEINARLTKYRSDVLNPLAKLRSDVLAFLNINGKTQEISKLVEENEQLSKELEEVNGGLSTAYNREAVIDTRDKAVSFNQTWGYLNRPLKRNSIPILIVFALIFSAAGLVGLYYLSPYSLDGGMQQPAIWITLAIVLIFGGIYLTLKFTGQL